LSCDSTVIDGELISVSGGWCGSAGGTHSATVPGPCNSAPRTTGGVLPVNTWIPSEVSASPSTVASGSWMKNALLLVAVTMPRVVTVWPTNGDVAPDPWMS